MPGFTLTVGGPWSENESFYDDTDIAALSYWYILYTISLLYKSVIASKTQQLWQGNRRSPGHVHGVMPCNTFALHLLNLFWVCSRGSVQATLSRVNVHLCHSWEDQLSVVVVHGKVTVYTVMWHEHFQWWFPERCCNGTVFFPLYWLLVCVCSP